jgi:hypothetical protein
MPPTLADSWPVTCVPVTWNEMLPVTSSFAFVSPVRVPVHVPSTFGQDGAGALASSPLPLEDPPPEDPLLDDPPLEDPLLDDPPPGDPPLDDPVATEPLELPDELLVGDGSLVLPEEEP